jgi:hypothetical protein
LEESLALKQELGDKRGIAGSLNDLGLVALEQGDYTGATSLLAESLTIRRDVGDKWGIAASLAGLAGLAQAHAQASRAARLLGAATAQLEVIGGRLDIMDRTIYARTLDAARSALTEHLFMTAWAEGQTKSLDQAVAFALAITENETKFSRSNDRICP